MRKQTIIHAEKAEPANPLLNTAIIAAVALAIAPAVLLGAARILHARADAAANAYEVKEAAPKRSSAAERRAQRLEARKARESKAQNIYPEITMEKVDPYYDGFGMDYDAGMEFNGPGMMPAPYMGGPGIGMMPPAYMGGPGMMPAYMGSINEFRRMPGTGTGFDNGFGRGRGNY